MAAGAAVPLAVLGTVGGRRLIIGPIDVALDAAREAWEGGLEGALFGAASESGAGRHEEPGAGRAPGAADA
jgi:hypothetical protein